MALPREKLLLIVQDIMLVLHEKEIAPVDALNVAQMLEQKVKEEVEHGKQNFLENGRFMIHVKQP